jgi:hypothetical protein
MRRLPRNPLAAWAEIPAAQPNTLTVILKFPGFVASVAKIYFNATQTQPEIYPVEAAAGAGLMVRNQP